MLSRFFIDRPIFATVLSVAIMLIGGIALANLPVAQYPLISPPGVSVAINYPGADAQTVADTVAAPVEQQVNGIPGMLYMSSQSGNDGSYSLSCTFDVGVDLNAALVLVQNRVTLALPQLPTQVQRQGITIRKKTPDILMVASFYSPNGQYDDLFLSNFALINIRDELLRVDGVADVNIFGERDYSIRVWLDPQKMASRSLSATDVATAIGKQNIQAAAGQLGQPPTRAIDAFQLPIHTLGLLDELEQFRDIIVRAGLPAAGAAKKTGPPALANVSNPGLVDPLQAASTAAGATPNASAMTAGNTGAASGVGTAGGSPTTSSGTSGSSTGSVAKSGVTGSGQKQNELTTGGANATGLTSASVAAMAGPAVRWPDAPLVRLRDVADVEMGAVNYNQASYFDGRPAVGLGIFQLPGTNALDVAERVRARLKQLSQRFPEGVAYTIGYDTTPFINESIDEVFKTLFIAVILVAVVVLFFLQDWRAMILPMIDVPVSLLGTMAVMAAVGYSLNNVSLFGLVLAIGIVVDDAIVVLENIERQIANGLDPRAATIKAMEEITGPIIGITLVLSAVFVPCAFISGITGRFFSQFAVTIAASTIISALNALTMTPARAVLIFRSKARAATARETTVAQSADEGMVARRPGADIGSATAHAGAPGHGEEAKEALPWWIFGIAGGLLTLWLVPPRLPLQTLGLQVSAQASLLSLASALYFLPGLVVGLVVGWFAIRPVNTGLGWLFRRFNAGFEHMTHGYGWTIGRAMHLSLLVLIAYAGLMVLTFWLFQVAPTGFVPRQDMGRCIAGIQLPDAASLERTKEITVRAEKICRETPGVAHTIGVCGVSFVLQSNGPNFGTLFVVLKPFAERRSPELSDEAIMARLRKRWAEELQDARIVVFGAAPIPGVSVAGGFKLIVEDQAGLGARSLQTQTDRLIGNLKAVPSLTSASTQFRSGIPQLLLRVNKDKVGGLGLSQQDVNKTLEIYQGSSYVNNFSKFGRTWHVTLQAQGRFRSDPSSLHLLQVRNAAGQMVSLGSVAEIDPIAGPIFINRYNLYTAAPITGSLAPGASTGEVIAAVDRVAAQTLPRSMKGDWTELMFLQILEGNSTPPIVVFSLVVLFVFLALAALYESWTLPLAVILVVPLCVLCAVGGVLLLGGSLDIFVQIGLVVLVGLACKNAILVVEFAREKHGEGRPVREATEEAARLRLRPILMTSFAFILGVVPMVFTSGAGAEMRRSLGTAVFSGMLGVTLFGIFLTPVFFAVIQGFGEMRLFDSPRARRAVSCALGLLLGLLGGYLTGRLGFFPYAWAIPVGACAGVLGVLAATGVHRRLRGS